MEPWRFWKNWWFFGIFFEKLAKNWSNSPNFLLKYLENIENFRFSRKNRPIFKTFCQSNAKIMRNLEKKKGLLPIYQGLLAFQSCQIPLSTKFFCQDKPWKFEEKKTKIRPKLSFVWRERGRQEGKKLFIFKKFEKIWKEKKNPQLTFTHFVF